MKSLERRHEGRAAGVLEINQRQIVVNDPQFLQSLVSARTQLLREQHHPPKNFASAGFQRGAGPRARR